MCGHAYARVQEYLCLYTCIHVKASFKYHQLMICHQDGENHSWLSLVIQIVLSALWLSTGQVGGLDMGGESRANGEGKELC